MSKTITIQVPATVKKSGKPTQLDVRGQVAWIDFGDTKVKCLLQQGKSGHAEFLTHYASGVRVGSITDVRRNHIHNSKTLSIRSAADVLAEKLVGHYGQVEVLNRFNNAPVINK